MSDRPPFTRDTIPVVPWGPSATRAEIAASAVQHHPRCYQNTGVPDDLPADLCDCRVLRMLDEYYECTDECPEDCEADHQGEE